MSAAIKTYLSEIGRKGGQKSRRTLTPDQARAMVEARERKKASQKVCRPWHANYTIQKGDEYSLDNGLTWHTA